MSGANVFDPGLQAERTNLAWRRTALAVAIGSIVSLRLLPAILVDPVWYLPGVVGVVFSGWMWWVARRRHLGFLERVDAADGPHRIGGASALLALAAFALAAGLIGAIVLVLTAFSGFAGLPGFTPP